MTTATPNAIAIESPANIAFESALVALQNTYTPWVVNTRKGDKVALMIRRKTHNLKSATKHIYQGIWRRS